MELDELSKAVYEDLNGSIVTVSSENEAYRIFFECDDWLDYSKRRRFELVFEDVAEANATPSASDGLHAFDNHPLLWQHNEEHVSMFFSSAPAKPIEVIGRLCEAHSRLLGSWRKIADYLHTNSDLLNGGRGLLARGPKRVIEEYVKVIGDDLCCSIVSGYTPHGGYRVMLFDECYVAFRNISVIEHPVTNSKEN